MDEKTQIGTNGQRTHRCDALEVTKTFFLELGCKLEGEANVEGPMVGALIGLSEKLHKYSTSPNERRAFLKGGDSGRKQWHDL